MIYTASMTANGQVTLPKALRVFLGVDGDRSVRLEQRKDEVVIKRRLTKEELFDYFDSNISEETRRIVEEDRRKGLASVREIKKEMANSPAVQAEWRRKYGN